MTLTSCTTYRGMDPRVSTLPACWALCDQQRQVCDTQCHDNAETCHAAAKASTKRFFCRYKHEQYVKGAIVARELNSYRDPLQCRKITCDCWADYRVCKAACTGTIHKRLEAPTVN